MNIPFSTYRCQRGLSIIELVVSLALVGLLLAAASTMMLQAYASEAAYRQQNYVQQSARTAIDTIADDIKQARCDPANRAYVLVNGQTALLPINTIRGGSGANSPVTNINNYTNPLYFNITDDTGTVRRVRYWLDGTDLHREIVTFVDESTTPGASRSPTAGVVIARSVTVFIVQLPNLLSSSTAPITSNINMVRVIIQTNINGQSTRLSADVTMRNNFL